LKLIDLHGRFGSYGGIRLQMKAARSHCVHCALFLLIALTSAGAGVVAFDRYGSRSKALQPARPPSPLGQLFDSDVAEFKGSAADILKGAVNNAPSSRPCLGDKPKFTIVIGTQDAELAAVLEKAREERIRTALEVAGIGDHQYSLEFVRGPQDQDGAVTVTYEQARDTDRPLIVITPRLPRQVKEGDIVPFQIDAGDTKTKWESGIKSLRLRNVTIPGLVEPIFQDSRLVAPCPREQETLIRSWPVMYTVPPNPPVLIEFRGIAEDFIGNEGTETAILTTGEFSGRYEWEHKLAITSGAAAGSTETRQAVAVFSLKAVDKINLSGKLVGYVTLQFGGPCPPRPLSGGDFRASLSVERRAGGLAITGGTPYVETIRPPRVELCNDYHDVVDWEIAGQLGELHEAFQQLPRQGGSSRRAHRTATQPTNQGTITRTYTLTVTRYPQ
jgi:hypothetical protein